MLHQYVIHIYVVYIKLYNELNYNHIANETHYALYGVHIHAWYCFNLFLVSFLVDASSPVSTPTEGAYHRKFN